DSGAGTEKRPLTVGVMVTEPPRLSRENPRIFLRQGPAPHAPPAGGCRRRVSRSAGISVTGAACPFPAGPCAEEEQWHPPEQRASRRITASVEAHWQHRAKNTISDSAAGTPYALRSSWPRPVPATSSSSRISSASTLPTANTIPSVPTTTSRAGKLASAATPT